MRSLALPLLFLTIATQVQTISHVSSCFANPTVETKLSQLDAHDILSYSQQKAALEGLQARYSNDVLVNSRYQILLRSTNRKSDLMVLIARYETLARSHSKDPDFEYLYARALVGTDTPKALHMLGDVLAQAPSFPWAHLGLASIHSVRGGVKGKYADGRTS